VAPAAVAAPAAAPAATAPAATAPAATAPAAPQMIYPEPAPVRRAGQGSEDYKREYDAWKSRRDDWQKQQEKEAAVPRAGRQEALKESTKILQGLPDVNNMVRSINKAVTLIDSGEHNIGSITSGLVGRGPIAQAIGKQFETTDAKNTAIIMDTVNKLAADGLKTLGSNPSTRDLEFWTANKPNAESSPELVKEWIESRKADLQRRIEFHKQVVTNKGEMPITTPSGPQIGEEKIINGITYTYDGRGWKVKR